jgi:hypothetical protein
MQAMNQFLGTVVLWGVVIVAVGSQVMKAVSRAAPEVAESAKKAATSKALSLIERLLK